jgi:hypothetical protein
MTLTEFYQQKIPETKTSVREGVLGAKGYAAADRTAIWY